MQVIGIPKRHFDAEGIARALVMTAMEQVRRSENRRAGTRGTMVGETPSRGGLPDGQFGARPGLTDPRSAPDT